MAEYGSEPAPATSCPPGTFSGSGSAACEPCLAGSYQPGSGEDQCILADPGFVVPESGAASQIACPRGTFSFAGEADCSPCDVGYFSNSTGQPSCARCPAPLWTTDIRSFACDACLSYHFYDGRKYEACTAQGDADDDCVDLDDRCVACPEDDNGKSAAACDAPGATLRELPLEKEWWRSTVRSSVVYECRWSRVCAASRNASNVTSAGDDLCARGHRGPRCEVCEVGWAYDETSNRCTFRFEPEQELQGNVA